MKCPKCSKNTVFDFPFQRVNPIGEIGIFWCEPCIKQNEPELSKNIEEDKDQVEKTLVNIFYK